MTATTARHKAATATRVAPAKPPIGCGELHAALLAADAVAHVAALARRASCEPQEISSDNGKSVDMRLVFEAMRRRGYVIDEPVKPQAQPYLHHNVEVWLVHITLPQGCACTVAFHEPAEVK